MSETELQRAIVAALRSGGFWVIRMGMKTRRGKSSPVTGEPGMPDLHLPALGWLEVKLPGKALNPNQIAWHARARAEGVSVWTVDSAEEALRVATEWRTAKAQGKERAA